MSRYFNYFPLVGYDLEGTEPPNPIIATDIVARTKFLNSVLNNSLIYYEYDIQEGETPETIAYKYYGDSELHWLVLYANQIVDSQYDWPLAYDVFNAYIVNKYGSIETAQNQIGYYKKSITKLDSGSGDTTVTNMEIDETTYNSLPESNFQEINMPDGTTVSITTTTQIVYAYDNEIALNESKRRIQLLDKKYAGQVFTELTTIFN